MITAFLAIFSVSVYAADFSIDQSKLSQGVIGVNGTAGAKQIRVRIQKQGANATYDYIFSNTNQNVYPLQLGDGTYTIMVLEHKAGNDYGKVLSETVTVSGVSPTAVYTNSIKMVDYTSSKTSISNLNALISGESDPNKKVDILFDYIITNFDYDYDKAATVGSNYIPVIDSMYNAKKGICYDYSSMLAGALRSNGIPTKLQMGYNSDLGDQYHAWNEVYVGGSWFKVDTTYDAQVKKAGLTVTMKKPNSNFTVLKEY